MLQTISQPTDDVFPKNIFIIDYNWVIFELLAYGVGAEWFTFSREAHKCQENNRKTEIIA